MSAVGLKAGAAVRLLVVVICCSFLSPSSGTAGTEASCLFYPYGGDDGDQLQLSPVTPLVLSQSFLFFGRQETVVYANLNGIVSFGAPYPNVPPLPFPLTDMTIPLIAAFWDTVGDEHQVFFRETTDLTLLNRAGNEIVGAFPSAGSFSPTILAIVTWDSVRQTNEELAEENIFQTVMATDGYRSYVLFIYGEIQWVNTLPNIGFNAGDGTRSFTVPGALTAEAINIGAGSNVDRAGLYLYQVDGSSIRAPEGLPSSAGYEFFIGFMLNIGTFADITLYVSSAESTPDLVNFSINSLSGFSLSDTVPESTTTEVVLPVELPVADNGDRNGGIWINANRKVTIHGLSSAQFAFSTDGFAALPCYAYTTPVYTYYAISHEATSGLFSTVLLVGCENDTEITITSTQMIEIPSDLTPGTDPSATVNPGESYTITLNQMETFQLESTSDLTGTRVASNKPLSFYSGHECAEVPLESSFRCSHLTEQLPPTVTWGKTFFTVPLNRSNTILQDIYKLITSKPTTNVVIRCFSTEGSDPGDSTSVDLSDAGSAYEFTTSQTQFCSIQASRPVLLILFAAGSAGDGEPFMMLIPPVEKFDNSYTVYGHPQFQNDIGIVVPAEYFLPSSVTINNAVISNSWTPIYCPDGDVCGYGTNIPIGTGTTYIQHTNARAKIGVYVYGIDQDYRSYGYPAGLSLEENCQQGDVRLAGGQTELEGRVEICVDGEWGTVCDDFWSDVDANVVCRRLGYYPVGATSFRNGHFGQGEDPIHLDNVFCTGPEETLLDCIHSSDTSDCMHSEDAGVRCQTFPAPTVTATPNQQTYNISTGAVMLTCNILLDAAADEELTVLASWIKSGSRLANTTHTTISPLAPLGDGPSYQTTLTISPLNTNDNGEYECKISFCSPFTNEASTNASVSIIVEVCTSSDADCNNGTCVDGVNGFSCDCSAGYTGDLCDVNVDECVDVVCQNGGSCQDLINNFTCVCADGFEGSLCEINIDDCIEVDCNNGVCMDLASAFECMCELGYTGVFCGVMIDDCIGAPCMNGATCVDILNNFTCICTDGFTGQFCETNIDDCEGVICQNGGSCVDLVNDFECNCSTGFTGSLCEENIDDCIGVNCNSGTCVDGVNGFSCDCSAGFAGDLCDVNVDECVDVVCQNGGSCQDLINNFTCVCADGFEGSLCEINIDDCIGVDCNNGVCMDLVNAFECMCELGYTGVFCDVMIASIPVPSPVVTTSSDGPLYAGTMFNFTCSITVDANEEIILAATWMKSGSPTQTDARITIYPLTQVSNSSSYESVLSINPLSTRDSGGYECQVNFQSPFEETSSFDSVNITVEDPPVPVVSITVEGSAIEGESYTLTCTVTVIEGLVVTPVLMWLYNDEQLTPGGDINIDNLSDMSTLDLRFEPLSRSYSGIYTCMASINIPDSDSSTSMTSHNVTVQFPPTIPMFTGATAVNILDEVTITCYAEGYPAPNLMWLRRRGSDFVSVSESLLYGSGAENCITMSSVEVRPGSENLGYFVGSYSRLVISNASLADAGEYQCRAENGIQPDSSGTVMLSILVPSTTPEIAGTRMVNESEEIVLTCQSEGHPLPELTWLRRSGMEVSLINNLHSARITITDHERNEINDCGVPVAFTTLSISGAEPDDSGEYMCEASNGLAPVVGSAFINVTAKNECVIMDPCQNGGKCIDLFQNFYCNCSQGYTGRMCQSEVTGSITVPEIREPPMNTTAELVNSINLTCEADGNPPPSFSWFRDGKLLPGEVLSYLFINETTPEDRGYYTCEATNDNGTDTSSPGLVKIPGVFQYSAELVINGTNVSTAIIAEVTSAVVGQQNTSTFSFYAIGLLSINNAAATASLLITVVSEENTTAGFPQTISAQFLDIAFLLDIGVSVSAVTRFDGCPREVDARISTLEWPETEIGVIVSLPCPCMDILGTSAQGASVTRSCGGSYTFGAEWMPVDYYSQCGFTDITIQLCNATLGEQPAALAETVVAVTTNTTALTAADITAAAAIVSDLTQDAVEDEMVRGNYLMSIDNLIQADPIAIEESQRETMASTRLLESLTAFTDLVNTSSGSDTYSFTTYALHIEDVNTTTFTGETLNILLGSVDEVIERSDTGEQINVTQIQTTPGQFLPNVNSTASVIVPMTIFEGQTQDGEVQRLSYSIFLHDSLFQSSLENQSNLTVGSIILTVRVNATDSTIGLLSSPLQVIFQASQEAENASSILCALWDADANGGLGAWLSDSCQLVEESDTLSRRVARSETPTTMDPTGSPTEQQSAYQVRYSQPGHFALLFDLTPASAPQVPSAYSFTLAVITYIGLALSLVCLVAFIATYLSAKSLRQSEHGQILINMSVALSGLYIAFLIGAHASPVPAICGISAALLQYFMLVFFGWTAAEAIYLYKHLVKVLATFIPRYVLKAGLIVWLAPLLIVILSAGPGYEYYYRDDISFCRPEEYPFWIGLIVPFGLIYIFNWVVFVIIMVSICKHLWSKLYDTDKKDTLKVVQNSLTIAIGLATLFGLGWGFGLAATSTEVEELTFVFQIIFSIFVGLQGVLMFILHGVRKPEARKEWKLWLSKITGKSYKLHSFGRSQTAPLSRKGDTLPASPSSLQTFDMSTLTKGSTSDVHASDPTQKRKQSLLQAATETLKFHDKHAAYDLVKASETPPPRKKGEVVLQAVGKVPVEEGDKQEGDGETDADIQANAEPVRKPQKSWLPPFGGHTGKYNMLQLSDSPQPIHTERFQKKPSVVKLARSFDDVTLETPNEDEAAK